jgi:hypothetical protein
LLVEEDYLDPCIYENDGDEKLDFNVNGDVDKEINRYFKDLDPHELENVKVNRCQHNIHSKFLAINGFDAWKKY